MNGLFNKHMSILHFLTSSNRLKIWKGEWQASKRAGRLRAVAYADGHEADSRDDGGGDGLIRLGGR